MILKPGSRFGSTHIGESKAMRDRGIHCAKSMAMGEKRSHSKHR